MQKSPNLVCREKSTLLVIDFQERLVPVIEDNSAIGQNIARLNQSAQLFGVPRIVSEQYPKGLGKTVSKLDIDDAEKFEKSMFSCREKTELFGEVANSGRSQVVVVGIEAHICVAQTCLDLISTGFMVFLVVDAIGSRQKLDHETAVTRLLQFGATPITTESVMFEWCETSRDENFKTISQLVK